MPEHETLSNIKESDAASSDPTLTRKQFIEKVVKGAAITGGAMIAPRIIDKFLVPPAYAGTSSCTLGDSAQGTVLAAKGGGFISLAPRDTYCQPGVGG
jgi:hypothetical protein